MQVMQLVAPPNMKRLQLRRDPLKLLLELLQFKGFGKNSSMIEFKLESDLCNTVSSLG